MDSFAAAHACCMPCTKLEAAGTCVGGYRESRGKCMGLPYTSSKGEEPVDADY